MLLLRMDTRCRGQRQCRGQHRAENGDEARSGESPWERTPRGRGEGLELIFHGLVLHVMR